MPKRPKTTIAELGELLRKHEGDRKAVAEELDVTLANVSQRIRRTPLLARLWGSSEPLDPNDPKVEERGTSPAVIDPIHNKRSVDTWQRNGREVFMTEIVDMLHDKGNIRKLDVFKAFDGNVGLHMARCLEMTQNVNLRQNVTLFEVAEKLKEQIMTGTLDEESEILKTRLFISCCEQQGKFHDRLLRGMEAMLKMTEKEAGSKKKKVGFRPLKELEELENATEDS
jgi:hypothetical protein